jgi:ribosomal protein S18 acetylase RimI-like enzyme
MLFESLHHSAQHDELILVDDGLCRFHLRHDGQLTIYEILVLPRSQRQGIGSAMLETLKQIPGATSIFAKCPQDLPANAWYRARGFTLEDTETTRSGRRLNLWRFPL